MGSVTAQCVRKSAARPLRTAASRHRRSSARRESLFYKVAKSWKTRSAWGYWFSLILLLFGEENETDVWNSKRAVLCNIFFIYLFFNLNWACVQKAISATRVTTASHLCAVSRNTDPQLLGWAQMSQLLLCSSQSSWSTFNLPWLNVGTSLVFLTPWKQEVIKRSLFEPLKNK